MRDDEMFPNEVDDAVNAIIDAATYRTNPLERIGDAWLKQALDELEQRRETIVAELERRHSPLADHYRRPRLPEIR